VEIVLSRRYRGPLGSANGGYACGRLAAFVDAGEVEVTLRLPPPLDRPLVVERADGRVLLLDGAALVAEARPALVEVDPPAAVALADAEAARERHVRDWSPDFADPYMFMNYWFASDKKGLPGNRSFYSNPEVDALLKKAVSTTNQAERTADYQQAQNIVINDAAYVYLFQKNYQVAMNKSVKGYVFNPMLEQIFNIATMHKE